MINYEEDSKKETTEDQLAYISRLANDQEALELQVSILEEDLKARKKELTGISRDKLPVAMKEVGMEKFKTTSGLIVDVSEKLTMSITKKNMPEAIIWLVANNLAALVKNQIVFTFDKGQEKECAELIEFLKGAGLLNYQTNESVNTSSVKSAVKELREDGVDIPMKLLGGFDVREAKITKA